MADKKISELTALTGANVADTDLLPIVDTSSVETKKITFGEFKLALDTATGFVRITGDTMTGDLTVPNIITAGNVDGRDVSADGTKLDGIEAGADVTDATNVASAGAAMTANNLSDLASATTARGNLGLGTAATTAATDYATAAQGALADTALQPADGYALETYVDTAIVNLINSAPATLDTLNELAAALDDDPNFATTITTSIGLKANSADLATVATTGAYADLTGKPTLGTAAATASTDYATAAQGALADTATQPAAVVAKTSATGSAVIPTGTEVQRDGSPSAGYLRFNSDAGSFEGYSGSSWGSIGGGATSDAIYENSATILENITIAAGRNGMSTGPIDVGAGVTVTVSSGSRWVVI